MGARSSFQTFHHICKVDSDAENTYADSLSSLFEQSAAAPTPTRGDNIDPFPKAELTSCSLLAKIIGNSHHTILTVLVCIRNKARQDINYNLVLSLL